MASNLTDPAAAAAALQAELEELVSLNNDYRLTRAFWIVSLVILLYDHFLTLSDEIVYLGRGRLSWTKGLFILNRYWPLFNLVFDNIVLALPHPSKEFCYNWTNYFGYAGFPVHFSIGTILILRVYVMYGCDKRLLVALCTFFALVLMTETIVIGTVTAKMIIVPLPPIPNFTGCLPQETVHYGWAYWLPNLILEFTLFSLALFKSVQVYRNRRYRGETPNILLVLIRDSVFYFGGVMTVIITNLVTWASARPTLFTTFVVATFTAHSILGCRMMLNIREAAQTVTRPESTIAPYTGVSDATARPSRAESGHGRFETSYVAMPEDTFALSEMGSSTAYNASTTYGSVLS